MASGSIILDVFGKNCFMRVSMHLSLSNINYKLLVIFILLGVHCQMLITLKPQVHSATF